MAGGISLLYCTLLHQAFAAVEASGSPVQLLILRQLFTLWGVTISCSSLFYFLVFIESKAM